MTLFLIILSWCSCLNDTGVYIYMRRTDGNAHYEFKQYTLHRDESKHSDTLREIKKKNEKMSNFKLISNFDWMKMKM
jgi:hypothetical protein